MSTTEMTVVEFATQHADRCDCGTERMTHIRSHVDLLIETAVAHGQSLWIVGQDDEGRVSLIWVSMSEDAWLDLMVLAAQLLMLKSALGMK